MKLLVSLACLFAVTSGGAQEMYAREIDSITNDLRRELTGENIMRLLGRDSSNYKIAIVGIETDNGRTTKLTELLETELVINLAASNKGKYSVYDRNYISKLLVEKNIPKAYGNKKDLAKNLGRLKAAQIMVVGRLDDFNDRYRLLFTIMSTADGEAITGAKGYVTATPFIKRKNSEDSPSAGTLVEEASSGSARSSLSVRSATDDMDPDCQTKNVGTIEIVNNTKFKVNVSVTDPTKSDGLGRVSVGYATIGANESTKLHGIHGGRYDYGVQLIYANGSHDDNYRNGTVQIIKCKEVRINIK